MLITATSAFLVASIWLSFSCTRGFSKSKHMTIELNKRDRIFFFGDSITREGSEPGGYVSIVRETLQKKYKGLELEVIGSGVDGHRVPDLLRRLEKDIISKQPNIVIIYIGINDVGVSVFSSENSRDEQARAYEDGLRQLVNQILGTGAKVILCTPSINGENMDAANRFNHELDRYAMVVQKLANASNIAVCDLRQRFVEYLINHNPQNQTMGILTRDGVHLNAAGNAFVADGMLEVLGATK